MNPRSCINHTKVLITSRTLAQYQLANCKTHVNIRPYTHANRLKPYFHPCDRKYSTLEQEDGPDTSHQGTDPTPQNQDLLPRTNDVPANDPTLAQKANDDADSSSDQNEEIEVSEIIKAGKVDSRKVYQVKVKDKSGSIWLYAEDVPDVMKRNFHIHKTQAGKRRKRRRKTP